MIVGTAGHIDHGKTSLVRALTGVETDRLAEEKARGISIDLGFAYQEMDCGEVMGFVDVPGHERLMKTMLAGATGIDFVLLVVAADDGVMPQTREHLAVVELLGLTRGVVALTKCDLVDPARVGEVTLQIRALLADGPLADVEIIPVSAQTGEGVGLLRARIEAAETHNAETRAGPLRFAVDRSFSLSGAGTVVTGVIVQGEMRVGDILTLSPAGTEVRVRSLHVQNRPGDHAHAGQRCGVSLGGRIATNAIHRGDYLVDPALHQPKDRVDAELRLLESEPRALRHWREIRFHHGAAEIRANVALLQDEPLRPGEGCKVQLVLDRPIAAAIGDRFVIRSGNGERTMGGGRLIDLHPPQRRRKQPRRLEQLAAMAMGDPAQSLAAQLDRWPSFVEMENFRRDWALSEAAMAAVLSTVPHRAARWEGVTYLFGSEVWNRLENSAMGEVQLFHKRYPQLLGPNLKRMMSALGPRLPRVPAQAALGSLVAEKKIVHESGIYRCPGHGLGLDRADEAIWKRVEPLLGGEDRYRPPRLPQLCESLAVRDFDLRRVLKMLAREDRVVEIAPDCFVLRKVMGEVAGIVQEIASEAEDGLFGAAQLRDRLDNGRKVSIQMLEFFDRRGMTARRGDLRVIDPGRVSAYVQASPR